MKKLLAGIIIGAALTFGVKQAYAAYQRLELVHEYDTGSTATNQMNLSGRMKVVWDEHEKTNCYIFLGRDSNSISCVRSMH